MSQQRGWQKSHAAADPHMPRPPAVAWLASLATALLALAISSPRHRCRSSNRILGHGCQTLFKQQPAALGEHPHLERKPTTTKRTSSLLGKLRNCQGLRRSVFHISGSYLGQPQPSVGEVSVAGAQCSRVCQTIISFPCKKANGKIKINQYFYGDHH